MENEKITDYPGHIELRLDRKTGEVFEEFIPDDNYIYVVTGKCEEKNNALFIDAVSPPKNGEPGRCDGCFFGYPSKDYNIRSRYRHMITLYPRNIKTGIGMHEKLMTKRTIPIEKTCSESFYKDRYKENYITHYCGYPKK